MTKFKTAYTFLLIFIFSVACGPESKTINLKPKSLLSYGVPITILAPDSATVETMDFSLQKDITVRKGDDYFVQIFAADATTNDIAVLKARQMEDVQSNPYFSKLIEEEEDGFIFENRIDSTHANYDFRFFQIKGDREYIFQTGLIGKFTLEDVERMYEAVHPVEEK